MKAFVTSGGVELAYSENIRPAYGQCSQAQIELLPGLSPAVEFSVLAHETGHHLLHFGGRHSETTKRVRETEAKAVAFVVCQAVGLDAVRCASEYIQLCSGDQALIAESLEHIRRASGEIIAAISAPD